MGFAFLESYWFEPRPKASRCPRCRGARGAIVVQYSLNVNQPQSLKEPICPRCEKRWAEKTYPPIQWCRTVAPPLKSAPRRGRKETP